MSAEYCRFIIIADLSRKNRAYVIDEHGNRVYYGTRYQCKKFINFMQEGDAEHENGMDGER